MQAPEGSTKLPNQFVVILDKTILHPQGGGQPNDEGHLTDGKTTFKISSLATKDEVIWHIGTFEPVDSNFSTGSIVTCHVDEVKRRLFARIHSAGHLLDMAMTMAGRTDLQPSKGYHFAEGAYVEYIGNVEEKDRKDLVDKLNENCAKIITQTPESMAVFKKMCSYEEANTLLEKAGGVPPYIPKGQSLRVLKLTEGDAGCPCGGTHVQHVKDIAKIIVSKITKKGKNIQVKYEVC